MKKIFILLLSLFLVSCGMTYEEIEKKKEFCIKNGLEYRIYESFGMRIKCFTNGDEYIYTKYDEEDKEQIKFCRDNGMNYYESRYGNIKCEKIFNPLTTQ